MMTKTQFAKSVVKEFTYKTLGIKDYTAITDWEPYLFYSSQLTVCLEFLGLLKGDQLEYSASRAGIERVFCDDNDEIETAILTTRELLSLLPD